MITESLNQSVHLKGEHGYGGIWGGEGASFHHNLFAHHVSRLPRFSGSSTTPNSPNELVDFRNNVIYNWRSNNTYGGEKGRYNVVNNFYKPGPATRSKKPWMVNPSSPLGKFFISGNYIAGNEAASKDNWTGGGIKVASPDSARALQAFPFEFIREESAEQAYVVVLKNAGASFKRDAIDTRIVQEVQSGTATFGKDKDGIIDSQQDVGGWPELKSTPAPKDSDADGMPDAWEVQHKLNPADGTDAGKKSMIDAYDNLEVYLNDLVKDISK
jgi:hypothetical protein